MPIPRIPRTQGEIYHTPPGVPYHVGNSVPGVFLAKRLGFRGIDLDTNASEDNIAWGCHWGKPMLRDGFRDPLGKLPRDTDIHRMVAEEVERLETADGHRIRRMSRLIKVARRIGLTVEVEAKPSPPLYHAASWKNLAGELDGHTRDGLLVKVLMDLGPHPENRLKAAHEAGFRTVVIVQGHRIDPAWGEFIDARRG